MEVSMSTASFTRCAPVLLACCLLPLANCDDDDDAKPNQAPVAVAGGDSLVGRGATIALRGSGSSDADGAIVRYEWLIEGQTAPLVTASGDTVTVAPLVCDSDFACMLRVVDDAGAESFDTLHVRVRGPDNCLPTAVASGPAAAAPDSIISLHATAGDVDGPALVEWSLGGSAFVRASVLDTAVVAPRSFDMDYQCILRVTDDSGAVALDTHHVIVSWIRSPNGGEAFTVGDSLTVQLFAVPELVGLKLIVERAGEPMDLNVGGFTGSFSPVNDPTITFAIPDTIYDSFYGAVSTVSDSCRIRVFLYMDSQTYVQSAGCFSIHPRP